jgi:uncharacterized phage protein gp47/JayE
MTTFPLPTLAATIDATGVSAPSFADVLSSLQATLRAIYGWDLYLGADTQDSQLVAAVAEAITDANQAVVKTYNDFSPATAQGAGLSSVVKINGIARKTPTASTIILTLTGTAGTTIVGGIVSDEIGSRWDLPSIVVIPPSGQISVTATCEIVGFVQSPAENIDTANGRGQIETPVPGWQSAINFNDAVPGLPIETDAALRRRQTLSTSLPAITPRVAISAALSNLSGVNRVKVYENDTGVTDANGIPGHSIAAVVEGGDITEILTEISLKKAPGTGTYGDVSGIVVDTLGVPNHLSYFPLTTVGVVVSITLRALTGYVSTTGDAIRKAVSDEINAFGIGTPVFISKIYTAANLYGIPINNTYDVISITMNFVPFSFDKANYGFDQGSWFVASLSADLIPLFNQAASCDPTDVLLTVI